MSQPKAWYPYLKRSLLITLGLLSATTIASCDGPTVQRQFRVVERWSSRWCASETHERLDGCDMSDSLNQLAGTVGVLGGGDGQAPARIDRGTATAACLAGQDHAIWDLNQLLSQGATLVARGAELYRYKARTEPAAGQKDYHLVTCHYRQVILAGPRSVLDAELP